MDSLLCISIRLMFEIPQGVLDFLFGLFGQTAPDLSHGIGSIFGCNV